MSLVAPTLDYEVRSFAAGYLDTPEADTLPRGGTPDAKNCLLVNAQSNREVALGQTPVRAILRKRKGAKLINASALEGGARIDSLYEFIKEGAATGILLVTVNGKLYQWDGNVTFTVIAGPIFTAGVPTRWVTDRDLAIGYDGTNTWAWDGTNAPFVPGIAAPTGEGGLADGGAGGTLPAATWEAVQTWYDATHDHESSITGPSAQLILAANKLRAHTIPSGAVPATVTHWRTYVRRVDINETYYRRVATTLVATGAFTESISDDARNLLDLAPLPNANDVPPVFAFAALYSGCLMGVKANDSFVWVAKVSDPQSQNAKDQIGVARGAGGNVLSIRNFGSEILVQKATRTDRLQGDRMPFIPQEVHSSMGNVGQDSAGEVDTWFYAWDERKGPYRMTLSDYQPLADRNVQTLVSSVNKASNPEIRFLHLKDQSLVGWSIATGSATRMRTLLFYNYLTSSWLPPITGLEYSCVTTFKTSTGDVNLYVGDYWGRIYQYFSGDVEGVPSGSLIARVSASSASTVTCDFVQTPASDGTFSTTTAAVAFVTAGSGLAGIPVLCIGRDGSLQWRRIQSNTASQLTLDTTHDSAWAVAPIAGATIVVGGIDWYWTTGQIDFGNPRVKKHGGFFYVEARPSSASFVLTIKAKFNKSTVTDNTKHLAPASIAGWGTVWGAMMWSTGSATGKKTRISRAFFDAQFQVSNPLPNQPVDITMIGVDGDPLSRRKAASFG